MKPKHKRLAKKNVVLLLVAVFLLSLVAVVHFNDSSTVIEEPERQLPDINIGNSPTRSDERLIRALSNGGGGDPPADQYYFVNPDTYAKIFSL